MQIRNNCIILHFCPSAATRQLVNRLPSNQIASVYRRYLEMFGSSAHDQVYWMLRERLPHVAA
jgi:hypothetical protein